MRTHAYTCNKGYADQYKGRVVKWEVPETIAEAIESGQFADEKAIVRNAVAQLNIRKGHAIQDATQELAKDADGKEIPGQLVSPNLSLADMERIAKETVASATERTRTPGGGQKVAAQKFTSAKEKIAAKMATATAEQVAEWLEFGLIEQSDADARLAELNAPKGTRRPK